MSKVKISGFYDEVTSDFTAQIELVRELGESYICPRKVNDKSISDYTLEEFNEKVKPLLDKYGVKISSIGSPFGKIALNDAKSFEAQTAKLREMVKE